MKRGRASPKARASSRANAASLREYRRKRDFAVTPEPGGTRARSASGRAFVVQKHAASRLHYDFRLELDGVLKSWAVPKGPSLDPADKRLAMQTEDHPVAYGDFEGIIPEGEYGGGTVLLWDRGTWEPLGDPHAAIAKGRLEFALHGEKLRGRWNLVRMQARTSRDAGKTWLLIKGRDDVAQPAAAFDVTEQMPLSVASQRGLDAIADDPRRTWHSNRPAKKAARSTRTRARAVAVDVASLPGARRGTLPAFIAPQLATLVAQPVAGDEWLHETKFDGYRVVCRVERGTATLWSRNEKDWTARLPGIARAAARLGVTSALLDGEVAVVAPNGVTSFNALQNALGDGGEAEPVYFLFDLMHLNGWDLTAVPLEQRKGALQALLAGAGDATLRYSDHVVGSGEAFLRHACRLALEGVVSKRRDAPYASGRGRAWLKVKCIQEQEFVVGGFTEPEGRRTGIGALLLGVHDDTGALVYVGKVGTGFGTRAAAELRRRLDALAVAASPFATRPPGATHAHWARPELVGEVEFTEWTPDGRLRHPAWKGLREDKAARDIVREKPAAPGPRRQRTATTTTRRTSQKTATDADTVAGVRITHPSRVVYPPQAITKLDLARFYETIADWILPQLHDRPTSFVRCPDGLAGECFYQKHVRMGAPAALRRVQIREKKKVGEYLLVDDLAALISVVQINVLEIHTWNAVYERLETPDRLVFDLDPAEDVPWPEVVAAARLVREFLAALGLTSFLKTTGGKGLHLVTPIETGPDWDECLAFARGVAEALATQAPRRFTADVAKSARHGRIYVDYLRNQRGATAIAAYSTRARAGAPVSTPIEWDELGPRLRPDHYTVTNLPRRLASLRRDPWADLARTRQRLPRTPA